jgi:hypothetical protein
LKSIADENTNKSGPMELDNQQHISNSIETSERDGTDHALPLQEPLSANVNYVLAERNKRARALWAETPVAMVARKYLNDFCRLSEETMRYYNIGLVDGRSKVEGQPTQHAICVPVPDGRGPEFAPCLAAEAPAAKRRGQYVFLGLPGTKTEAEEPQWKRGPTLTMYVTPEKGGDLVLCSSVLEAICLAQMLSRCCKDRFTIIVSTHRDEHPPEWHSSKFWARWQRVYFAQSSDRPDCQVAFAAKQDLRCAQLAGVAERPVLRVRLPESAKVTPTQDWMAYFRSGGTAETALQLFNNAQLFAPAVSITQNLDCLEPPRMDEFIEGEYGDVTHDLAYNYVGGYYYYPFSVLHFALGVNGQKQITRLTRLLRNDGRILGWSRVPSSKGTSDVVAADDGTLLSRPPEVSDSATWSLDHILAYARSTRTGGAGGRQLAEILRDIRALFEQCIWLPYREQLYLLLFTVPVTFVQELFSAVPYLLIQGPKGSGKSELAHLLSWVSSNSTIIGSGSHAFTAAQIDQARGLLVLDDRETLSADALDTDLLEILKVGYKRATGIRGIIGQNRKIIRQHVYGVKAITCVSGVEEIVGTRMLRIRTAPYSKARALIPIRRFQAADQESAHRLRQEMHSWTFRNVSLIRAEYDKLAQSGSRWDEITAPLRALAALCEDAELQSKLGDALNSQGQQEAGDLSVEAALNRVMEDLVRRGMTRELSITHVRNELASRLSNSANRRGPHLGAEPPPESWITRTLKAHGWLKAAATVRRTRVRKKVLQRIWELDSTKVATVLESLTEAPQNLEALSFCQDCAGCEYKTFCEIKGYLEPGATSKTRG